MEFFKSWCSMRHKILTGHSVECAWSFLSRINSFNMHLSSLTFSLLILLACERERHPIHLYDAYHPGLPSQSGHHIRFCKLVNHHAFLRPEQAQQGSDSENITRQRVRLRQAAFYLCGHKQHRCRSGHASLPTSRAISWCIFSRIAPTYKSRRSKKALRCSDCWLISWSARLLIICIWPIQSYWPLRSASSPLRFSTPLSETTS